MRGTTPPGRRANRLADETSPYLLQHRFNPVDWRPWGSEALDAARTEDRPIFLSIGYAACHWCHVMERESFEDEAIARILNEGFVPIKVDREERPDLDEIYMTVAQLMTGQGGWPLNVFLTPSAEPFFAGTYFPPEDRWGRPGFATVLTEIRRAWETRRSEVDGVARGMAVRLRSLGEASPPGDRPIGRAEIAAAVAELRGRFERAWGGFGGAPKFPPHGALRLLLRHHVRSGDVDSLRMAESTLDAMARGGIYDHVGGGFARYSVDERWHVPHFEKMLYDQALLVPAYVDGWLVTGKDRYRRVVVETLDFVRRELTDPGGGFLASLDADSEGHEGSFYVWSVEEVRRALGAADGDLFCGAYAIEDPGSFEGRSIPNLLGGDLDDEGDARLRPLRARLLEERGRRPRPATDDKVLTAWNGLMVSAFAVAHRVFGRSADLEAARRASEFLVERSMRGDRLLATWREGRARLNGYLDDYAFLARGFLELYEASFERRWLDAARTIAGALVAHFRDAHGRFLFTSDDHEALLARRPSVHDGALPAGSGVAAETALRLGVHLGDDSLRRVGEEALRAYRAWATRAPSAFAALLAAADLADHAPLEVAVVGPPDDPRTRALLHAVGGRHLPGLAIAASAEPTPEDLPLLAGRATVRGQPAAFVCRGGACREPVTTPAALLRHLDARES